MPDTSHRNIPDTSRRNIIEALEKCEQPTRARAVAGVSPYSRTYTERILRRLAEEGQIQRKYLDRHGNPVVYWTNDPSFVDHLLMKVRSLMCN